MGITKLARQDSNLNYRGQNPAGCQLPHEPITPARSCYLELLPLGAAVASEPRISPAEPATGLEPATRPLQGGRSSQMS